MTRQSPAPPVLASAEARYFQLISIGPDDGPEAPAPAIDPVSEPTGLSLMAIGIVEEDPVCLDLWHKGREASMTVLVRNHRSAGVRRRLGLIE